MTGPSLLTSPGVAVWLAASILGCSLLPPPSRAFRSWLFYISCIEIWSPKISHTSPAEFLGREIMYNKTIGKVISPHESCNFPAIDFLKITHCLRAVKANLTRRMSLFRTPWLAIVINSYNYYWLRGGFSFVEMLLKWQPSDGLKRENGNATCCSHLHKRNLGGQHSYRHFRTSPMNLRETRTFYLAFLCWVKTLTGTIVFRPGKAGLFS